MDLQLSDKNAFISGSTTGIGLHTAKALLAEGANVWINGRDDKTVAKAVAELQKTYPDCEVGGIAADFADVDSVKSLIEQLSAIDILINNVGIYSSQAFAEVSDADWQRQLEVNLMSGVRLSRVLLPKMLERGWGRVIFVSSECASLVPEDLIPYSTTKAALLALSRGLAQLTKGSDVTVNAVLPGSTLTDGAEQFLENLAKDQGVSVKQAESNFFDESRSMSLLGRFASATEVANTIAYYCSPLTSASNGAAVRVDGGTIGGIL